MFGLIAFVFGLPGFFENVRGWNGWLEDAFRIFSSVPFGSRFAWAAQLLDYPWVYWGLLFIGITCFFQAERIAVTIHRIKGRVEYMVAVQMGHENFISENDAILLVMKSQWGRTRRARNEKPRSILDSIQWSTLQTDPARDARSRMVAEWCKLALSQFALEETECFKEVDGKSNMTRSS
jgi:hypothetical protein